MRDGRTSRRLDVLQQSIYRLVYQLCAAENFADVADLKVESPISILSGKTNVVVVKKDYVVKDMV